MKIQDLIIKIDSLNDADYNIIKSHFQTNNRIKEDVKLNLPKADFSNYSNNLITYVSEFLGYDIKTNKRLTKYIFPRYVLIDYILKRYRQMVFTDEKKGCSLVGKLFNKDHSTIISAENVHNQLIGTQNVDYMHTKNMIYNIIDKYNETLNK